MGYILNEKYESMSKDEVSVLQGRLLVNQVKRVYENVPFYREKMKAIGIEPGDIKEISDINKLPFTTKDDLKNNYPFGVTAVPKSEIVRVQGTSGTTGKLTLASYTNKDVEIWKECMGRSLAMAGITKEDIIHICYGYGLFTGGMGMDYGAQKIGAMVVPMSVGNTKRQIMCLEDFGATALACTPSYALFLAESIAEQGRIDALNLKVGIHGAEPWTDKMRQKIENILKIECFDIYGMCEIMGPGIAMECEKHIGLHIHQDHFYPEVVNLKTDEVLNDGEDGELILTTLTKEAMPLLRYRTRDITSLEYSTCECGRTSPRISKLKGRTDDMKVVRGVNIFPTQIETVLLSIGEEVSNHYLIIIDRKNNTDKLTIQVEVNKEVYNNKESKNFISKKIEKAMQQTLGISVIVELLKPKTLERSQGKAIRLIDKRSF